MAPGSYVLLELLGEGGMGQVFKARNWKLGQIFAVKLIRKEWLTNSNTIKRFYREIRPAAQLEHPHIVRAFDADEVNGTHFFVMEFVEGIDLNKLVKKQGALDVRLAKRPEDRYQTRAELAQALETVVTSTVTDITGVTQMAPPPLAPV